jgi:hypothetical protein
MNIVDQLFQYYQVGPVAFLFFRPEVFVDFAIVAAIIIFVIWYAEKDD